MLQPRADYGNSTLYAYDFQASDGTHLGYNYLETRALKSVPVTSFELPGEIVYDLSGMTREQPQGFPPHAGTDAQWRKYATLHEYYTDSCYDAGTLYKGAQITIQPCIDFVKDPEDDSRRYTQVWLINGGSAAHSAATTISIQVNATYALCWDTAPMDKSVVVRNLVYFYIYLN
jgi:hypothetical protein